MEGAVTEVGRGISISINDTESPQTDTDEWKDDFQSCEIHSINRMVQTKEATIGNSLARDTNCFKKQRHKHFENV